MVSRCGWFYKLQISSPRRARQTMTTPRSHEPRALGRRGDVPAVVVGGTLNGLGVVRSLALGGVRVYMLETTRRCVAAWSRHCRYRQTPSLEGPGLVDRLIALAQALGCRPVLFLTSDQSVIAISEDQDRLQQFYRFSLPAPEILAALADKTLFQQFALRQGLPIPRGLSVSAATIEQLAELNPPVIIKPADKRLVLSGAVERAVRAETIAEAKISAARMLRRSPQLIAQEWIEGPDADIFFTLFSCDRNSRVIGLFPGRKLLCSPPAIGSTALCVAAPDAADALYPETLQFIQRTSYQGLGSLEFKRDSRTGRFLIIEPTVGRTDWQEEIATLAGVNLPLLTYWAEFHRSESVRYERDRISVAWRASKEARIPPGTLEPTTRVVDGLLRWADPVPALYYYGYERLIVRAWRRVYH